MLIHVDERTTAVSKIEGGAHVVIAIAADGHLHLQSYCNGKWDSSYGERSDEAVLRNLPPLLAELREQLGIPGQAG